MYNAGWPESYVKHGRNEIKNFRQTYVRSFGTEARFSLYGETKGLHCCSLDQLNQIQDLIQLYLRNYYLVFYVFKLLTDYIVFSWCYQLQ